MQSSDTLLMFLRQKLTEQTSSIFRLFQAVDLDMDGCVSVQDFIGYCKRFSLPPGVVTEEQVNTWFNRYKGSDDIDYTVDKRRGAMASLGYSSFKHFLEDRIESTVVSQEDEAVVTIDTVRRALVRYMHSLGYSMHKFYKVCAHGAEFLYEHHLRNILDTRCGIVLSNSAWNSLWRRLKSDPRTQHMTIHEFNILLQQKPDVVVDSPPPQTIENVIFDESVSDTRIKFKEEGVHNDSKHVLEYSTKIDGNVVSIMLYLAEKFAAISSPRILFGRIDRRGYNYLTINDFIIAVKDLTDIEINEELASDIFRIVSKRTSDESMQQLMSYQGFLNLLSCQEYLVPLRLFNRPSSAAAMYRKRSLTPIVECALRPPQHGRKATISVPVGEVNVEASLTGSYGPNYNGTVHSSVHPVCPTDHIPQKQTAKQNSANSDIKSDIPLSHLQTGDDQRYTIATLNSLPLTVYNDKKHMKDNGFITTEAQMERHVEHIECNAFVQDVMKKLRIRGESMRILLSEAFHNRKIISSKELLWFFRNRLGISVSPLTILQTFKLGGNDTIQMESILSVFKTRPGSAAQPRPRSRTHR